MLIICLITLVVVFLVGFFIGYKGYQPSDYCGVDYSPAFGCGVGLGAILVVVVGGCMWLVRILVAAYQQGLL